MKYVKLGQTGLQVPAIVAGCMRLNRLNEMAAAKHIENAVAHGVNFFDHADIYGGGKSEEIFGKLLAEEPGLREKMFIQSKCAIHDGLYDFDGDYIRRSVHMKGPSTL